MAFMKNTPDPLNELATKALPDPWREKVERGDIELKDVPLKVRSKAVEKGIHKCFDEVANNIIDNVRSGIKYFGGK